MQISKTINLERSSSSSGFRYFNISVKDRHSALSDSIATCELFNKLLELMNNIKQ